MYGKRVHAFTLYPCGKKTLSIIVFTASSNEFLDLHLPPSIFKSSLGTSCFVPFSTNGHHGKTSATINNPPFSISKRARISFKSLDG